MRDNAAAGSERFGYSISGQVCSEDNWSNNVAHGVLSGKRCETFLSLCNHEHNVIFRK